MGLDEDAVDLLEIDGADLVAHRFDQRAEAQIAGAPQQAFGGADDKGQGIRAEGVVAQAVWLGRSSAGEHELRASQSMFASQRGWPPEILVTRTGGNENSLIKAWV